MAHFLPKSLRGSFSRSEKDVVEKVTPSVPTGDLSEPQDVELVESTSTSVRVRFRLPEHMAGAYVSVHVRGREDYLKMTKRSGELRYEMNEAMHEEARERMRLVRAKTPTPAFGGGKSRSMALLQEISEVRRTFSHRTKEMFGSDTCLHDDVIANKATVVKTRKGEVLQSTGFHNNMPEDLKVPLDECCTMVGVAGVNNIVVSSLPSGFWIELCLRCVSANDDGTEGVKTSKYSRSLSVWTQAAEWQQALASQGLEELAREFAILKTTTPESWNEIILNNGNYGDNKSLDPVTLIKLQDAIATTGFVSEAEKKRLAKEKGALEVTVANVVEAYANPVSLQEGDAVREIKHPNSHSFGVVASNTASSSSSKRLSKSKVLVKWGLNAANDEPVSMKTSALERINYNAFLSHAQHQAQSQCGLLSLSMRQAGFSVWYDQDAERLEARDMVRGIANSDVFILFLTQGYFSRYFCRLEASTAMKLGKQKDKLVVIYESDPRTGFGDSDFIRLAKSATSKYPEYYDWITESEAIPMARRAFQRAAMLKEVGKRIIRAGGKPAVSVVVDQKSTSSKEATSSTTQQLQAQVQELQSELFEARAENTALWTAVRKLAKSSGVNIDG